jgi:hypothetical protein
MVMKIWALLRDAAGGRDELVDAGVRQGGREGGFRREGVKLLGGVVMSKARRAAYIGSRDGNATWRSWRATSRARQVQGALVLAMASAERYWGGVNACTVAGLQT